MVIFIINSIVLAFSFVLIAYNYLFIKNQNNNIELRIKRFIFGGIELLLVGIVLVTLAIIGSRKLVVAIDEYLLIIIIILSILIYFSLLFLWNRLFGFLEKYYSKKSTITNKYKLKSISIYGLVYSFGILFYLIYAFILLK